LGWSQAPSASTATNQRGGMWTYENLMKLSPNDFERILADLWRAMGYPVTVAGGPDDRGADILATMERGADLT